MEHIIEDLTGKTFKIITHNGKDGILQSSLWKKLAITSRDGSRLALRLEKQSLIKREKILEKGRWTYKLLPVKLPVDTESIDKVPCLMCPVEHMCSEDGSYSPNNCNLIQDWLLSAIDSLPSAIDSLPSAIDSLPRTQLPPDRQQSKQDIEISSRQAKQPARRSRGRATKK
jgi:hypothetical protein